MLGDNIDTSNLTKENFNSICSNIKLFDTVINGTIIDSGYLSYLNGYSNVAEKYCQEILDFTKVLDDGLILLINSIRTSSYHELINSSKKFSGDLANTNFEFLYNEMFDYYNVYKSLKKYVLKNKLIDD